MRFLGLLIVALIGCHNSTPTGDSGVDTAVPDTMLHDTDTMPDDSERNDGGQIFDGSDPNALDLLIVTDPEVVSSSLVGAPVPWIVQALLSQQPSLSLRVGVISSDMGDPTGVLCTRPNQATGALVLPEASCGLVAEPFLEVGEDTDVRQLSEQIRCRVGPLTAMTSGACPFRQPLEAILAATLPSSAGVDVNGPAVHGDGMHQGFFRAGAYLAVLILTVPDDCSMAEPLSTREGEPPIARCFRHADALHPTSRFVETLMLVRPGSTFGVFAIGNTPRDLSGAEPSAILTDERMREGNRLEAQVTRSNGWAVDSRLAAGPVNLTPSRRIVEFLSGLDDQGIRVGSFSLLGAYAGEPAQVFEEIASPIAAKILGTTL